MPFHYKVPSISEGDETILAAVFFGIMSNQSSIKRIDWTTKQVSNISCRYCQWPTSNGGRGSTSKYGLFIDLCQHHHPRNHWQKQTHPPVTDTEKYTHVIHHQKTLLMQEGCASNCNYKGWRRIVTSGVANASNNLVSNNLVQKKPNNHCGSPIRRLSQMSSGRPARDMPLRKLFRDELMRSRKTTLCPKGTPQ